MTYVFDKPDAERELHRLQLIEAAVDSTTCCLLDDIGIEPGWHCLELGSGAGSIFRWLGERVGPHGQVVGVDKHTEYIRHYAEVPFYVVEGDFLTTPLRQHFDLIHSRYVLIHNRDNQQLLEKMYGLLKPGGYLLLEEPDFRSTLLNENRVEDAHQRVNQAICKMFVDADLDPSYGLRLPERMARCGFDINKVNAEIHLCSGKSAIASMMAESTRVLSNDYIATGLTTESDIRHYIDNTDNADFWSVFYSTVSVIGRRPIGPTA